MKNNIIAFDIAQSARHIDENGFLHVSNSHITKETVNPYYGREVPDWEKHGLNPEKIYYAYRAGEEIAKGASTFNGLPLLMGHHEESAADPQKEYRVGSLGTDAIYRAPYLDNSLTITDADAIKAIQDGTAREISCAYMYDPDFVTGEFDGQHYDFVMRNIRGNHAALVKEGRAGSDVVVADQQIKTQGNKGYIMKMTALMSRLKKLMAKDEGLSGNKEELAAGLINAGVEMLGTGKQDGQEIKGEDEEGKMPEGFANQAAPATDNEEELAADAEEDVFNFVEMYGANLDADKKKEMTEKLKALLGTHAEPEATDAGEVVVEETAPDKDKSLLFKKTEKTDTAGDEDDTALDEDTIKEAMDKCGLDADNEEAQKAFIEGVKFGEKADEKKIGDAAEKVEKKIQTAADAQVAKMKNHLRSLSRAANDTRTILGHIDPMAFDSANAIYGAALKKVGINLAGTSPAGWRDLYNLYSKMSRGGSQIRTANDSADAFKQEEKLRKCLSTIKK